MDSLKKVLRNRNVILTSALLMGLFWGKGARWTEPITLPALAIVMTLSTIGLPASTLRSYRSLLTPAVIGGPLQQEDLYSSDGLGRFHDRLHHLAPIKVKGEALTKDEGLRRANSKISPVDIRS